MRLIPWSGSCPCPGKVRALHPSSLLLQQPLPYKESLLARCFSVALLSVFVSNLALTCEPENVLALKKAGLKPDRGRRFG